VSTDSDVAILGAGPYGLAVASHLRNAGVDARVFGRPMSFWQEQMPAGMLLRSNWSATNISDRHGDLNLEAYQADSGASFSTPVPLTHFVEYGLWFQRHTAPDVDTRLINRIEQADDGFRLVLDDGDSVTAHRVIVAAGIGPFAWLPPALAGLPKTVVSHSSAHRDLGSFAGREVLVVGGGQSALESAALLHEGGASVEVLVRAEQVIWLRGGTIHRKLGRATPIFYGPTDVGPLGISRLLAQVGFCRYIPDVVMGPMARRSIRPAGSRWLVDRLADVPLTTGRVVTSAAQDDGRVRVTLDDASERVADHVLCGTGYRVDIDRYEFLPPELAQKIDRVNGYPRLGRGFESSVSGLHFVGAPAASSYGPVMRFVSGTWYTGRTLARTIAARGQKSRSSATPVEAA
jgi:FAD-dependent urate hydroxylase